jgi:tryptophanase
MNCEQDIRNQIFGCVALNNTKDKFTFTPQSPYNLIDETVFNASLSTMITDKAGNSLVSDYDFSFDTIAGDDGAPIAMCVDLLDDAGESTIDIYFNEDLDVNSLNSDSITVYEVDSGLIVTGSSVITNNMISFTPDSILDSNKVYALIVYDDITDLNGVSLVEIFRTFFNGSNL